MAKKTNKNQDVNWAGMTALFSVITIVMMLWAAVASAVDCEWSTMATLSVVFGASMCASLYCYWRMRKEEDGDGIA